MLTRKPRKGDLITWPGWPAGQVAVVTATPEGDSNLCWIAVGTGKPAPFIWRFHKGVAVVLNQLAEIVEEKLL